MTQSNVRLAEANKGYLAAEKGDKGGKGGNRGSDRDKEREGTSREEAGRKGGEKVSQDREHMAEIGRKGGEHSQGGGKDKGNSRNR